MTQPHAITDDQYAALQRDYGGRYVVRRGVGVIASARSLGELIERTDAMPIDWADAVIEYVERVDRLRVYVT